MMLPAVLSGFVLGAFAPTILRTLGERASWLLGLLPAALFVYFLSFLPAVAAGETLRFATPWVPAIGVSLSFFVDGLALLFALLISGIGTFVVIYTGAYLHGDRQMGRFYLYLLSFMAAMLGVVLADNIITLFVFWELTSLTSFLLIGYNHSEGPSRRAAMQALVVTGAGGLALLAGLLIMSAVAGGSMALSDLNQAGEVLRESPMYAAMTVLVLLGAFSKSAQVPLHFWLPNAMEAPTPVSAYLHSSTMVKAGVYLLARLSPSLGGTALWFDALVIFGGATMLTGAVLALSQTDLKRILAYSTVAGLGTLVMLIGIGTPLAYKAAAAFLITHALYKGGLFLIAGTVDHEAGTRDVRALGGLRSAMPISFAAAVLAGLSMSGIIPFIGFIAKEVMYEGALHTNGIVALAAVLGNALTVAAAGLVVVRPFFGAQPDLPKHPHEGPPALTMGGLTLAVLGFLAGIFHPVTSATFVFPMMQSLSEAPLEHGAGHLYLWHGITWPLVLSVVTLAIGITTYLTWDRVHAGITGALRRIGWGPDRGYDQAVAGLERFAAIQTRVQQTGYLRQYLWVSFAVIVAGVAGSLLTLGGGPGAFAWPAGELMEWLALALLIAGALVTTVVRSRVAAVAALGLVGYAVALIFLLFSAPDLAFTQFMVETLTVVILVLVLMRVPLEVTAFRRRAGHMRDAALSLAVGATVTVLLLAVVQTPLDLRLSEYFAETSVPEAHGHNIVNVILVDFRALDTLGEIFVVTVAGLSTAALLGMLKRRRRGGEEAG
ncbi:multisubunit sodium/proton antiporter, MrpA subunit [Limimonas halophila]|uniref:Multisubunit sodium/proton antiporter, MrpA subunit n=1 Tax=Limimonas halophila TaxID=1082479 RepID=A0A1G7NT97_9PROT|nr:putative monovalent cation/H+ antiporter subunit A [Limimonas halophila]SDF77153.1 multisubunit sodium/proton antiporter, MrpA subunit [Limimonas halophila]